MSLPTEIATAIAAIIYEHFLEELASPKLATLVTMSYVQQLFGHSREDALDLVADCAKVESVHQRARRRELIRMLQPSMN